MVISYLHPKLSWVRKKKNQSRKEGRTKCLWFDDENLRTYVRPHADWSTFTSVASPGNNIRSCSNHAVNTEPTHVCSDPTHLHYCVSRPVLPYEMQKAVLAVLQNDRALCRFRVDEAGGLAPKAAAGFKCNAWVSHLVFRWWTGDRRVGMFGQDMSANCNGRGSAGAGRVTTALGHAPVTRRCKSAWIQIVFKCAQTIHSASSVIYNVIMRIMIQSIVKKNHCHAQLGLTNAEQLNKHRIHLHTLGNRPRSRSSRQTSHSLTRCLSVPDLFCSAG